MNYLNYLNNSNNLNGGLDLNYLTYLNYLNSENNVNNSNGGLDLNYLNYLNCLYNLYIYIYRKPKRQIDPKGISIIYIYIHILMCK